MKLCKLEVLKKNRKYFAVKVNGYTCKLLINAESEKLAEGFIGEVGLDDISIRTKFGTDVIYKLAVEIEKQTETKGIVTFQHRYNEWVVHTCRQLGGKWDEGNKTWVFPQFVADKVEKMDIEYNEDIVTVEITNKNDAEVHTGPVTFMGYVIARAWGRDSGAKLGDGVAKLNGVIKSSGSVKNWYTIVKAGSIFRLQVSKNLLEAYDDKDFSWKIIEDGVTEV